MLQLIEQSEGVRIYGKVIDKKTGRLGQFEVHHRNYVSHPYTVLGEAQRRAKQLRAEGLIVKAPKKKINLKNN